MKCPKCSSVKCQPVTTDGSKQYCPDCNHAWTAGRSNEPEGTLTCESVISAKRLYDMITRGSEHPPEVRALLETQITGILIDQWFDGFRSGQLASIVYAKDYYGKGRNEFKRATTIRGTGGSVPEGTTSRQGSFSGSDDSADPRSRNSDRIVTERVAGVELRYAQKHVPIPESVYNQIAIVSEEFGISTSSIDHVRWDGTNLFYAFKFQ